MTQKRAFTLIEMLTVMAVIAILAGLMVGISGFANKKAALLRAQGEITALAAACESYKADAGSYPRDDASGKSHTDELDPRVEGDPTSEKYQKASLELYKALSGDKNANGRGKEKPYVEFKPTQLQKNSGGEIKFLKDPFGNSYGYSTAAVVVEEKYREQLMSDPATRRPTGTDLKGFNPTFDLWSTGGVISKNTGSGGYQALEADRKRWVKNW